MIKVQSINYSWHWTHTCRTNQITMSNMGDLMKNFRRSPSDNLYFWTLNYMWCEDEQCLFRKLFYSKKRPLSNLRGNTHMLATKKYRRGSGQSTFKHPDHLKWLSWKSSAEPLHYKMSMMQSEYQAVSTKTFIYSYINTYRYIVSCLKNTAELRAFIMLQYTLL